MVELASLKVMITLSISHNPDSNEAFDAIQCHQQERRHRHGIQGPSKASLQVTNAPHGIHGLNRSIKSSNNKDREKRITQHLALLFHSHRCISKDKGSVKNCGIVQTAVSTLS